MTAKLKAYPDYKASGIDWLGEIPSHWVTLPMKYILDKSSAGVWGDEAKENGQDVVCFRVADFDYPHLKLGYSKITYRSIPANQLSGRKVNFGDIIIEKSGGGDLNPVGRAVMSTFNGVATCSNFMHVISTNDKADNSYLNYLLATIYGKGINWRFFAQTTGIQNLNVKAYLSQPIPLPSLTEQQTIAGYLDEVCGKIDALVAEKQAQVDELRAYRTSIITETVTRGLNPDASLRPSGIDWLGNIPEHWQTSKFKFALAEIKDGSHFSPEIATEGLPYVTATDVRGVGINYATTKKINIADFTKLVQTGCEIYKDDILLVKDGATTGRVGMKNDDTPAVTLSSVAMLRPKSDSAPKYIFYLLQSNIVQNQINIAMAGAAMPRITLEKLGNFIGLIPPLSEQKEIADFLDAETAKIDEAIGELEAQLKDLADYKQAVITEAVTGKVDVRDWKPKD